MKPGEIIEEKQILYIQVNCIFVLSVYTYGHYCFAVS